MKKEKGLRPLRLLPLMRTTLKLPLADFSLFAKQHQDRIDRVLNEYLPSALTPPARLHQAMRYATLNGGKRIRPLLVYATGYMLQGKPERLDFIACAVELIHSYSLVHDDLPSMDNDDLRRGKPSCHKAFDEATAILVGDALHALAFEVLARVPFQRDEEGQGKSFHVLAEAIGSMGMVGGQSMDLEVTGGSISIPELEILYHKKTGALFEASVLLAAYVSPVVDPEHYSLLKQYAKILGLAFQIQDDLLDIEGQTEVLGKTQGSDKAQAKPTYPSLLCLVSAKERVKQLCGEAEVILSMLPYPTDVLLKLMEQVCLRDH